MRKTVTSLLLFTIVFSLAAQQKAAVDKVKFFEEGPVIKATLSAKFSKWLGRQAKAGDSAIGNFVLAFPDSGFLAGNVTVSIRGNFRRENCFIPPLRIDFKKPNSALAALGTLKLVSSCKLGEDYENYLLTEYLVYKMYNLLTEKSFRVRLLQLTYRDSTSKVKEFTRYAFLLEDTKDMAKRNKMREYKQLNVGTEQTNREQMTLVAIFQYMIGNTDWSVPVKHNIRLINDNNDNPALLPYPVPYDFDYCGLVNAEYAVPYEELGLDNVRQRLYRGYPRTMEELNKTLQVFKEKKEKIYSLVTEMKLLGKNKQKDIINYLDGFYDIINKPKEVASIFIKNARKN